MSSLAGCSSCFVVLALAATGCSTARTNARLEPGASLGVSVMGAYVAPGHDDGRGTRRETNAAVAPTGEVLVQYAWTSAERTGTAVQLKVPLLYFLASLDVYHQFGDQDRWSHGGGVEIGLAPAIYYLVTRHDGARYESLTARASTTWLDGQRRTFVTPQVTLGWHERRDLFGFAAYTRTLGSEVDIEVENHDFTDLRRDWILVGVGARF